MFKKKKSYDKIIEFLRLKRIKKRRKRFRKNIKNDSYVNRDVENNQTVRVAPNKFSFINNTNEMLEYLQVEENKNRKIKKYIKFDLRKIEVLTSDAIAILVSMFTDSSFPKGNQLSGTAPKNTKLREMFLGSGFYEHVHSKRKPTIGEHNFLLHKVSKNKVDPLVAKKATDFAAKFTFGDERKFRPIYEILIELMANTNNHASPISDGYYEWWLYVFFDKETKVTSYSFLDFGIGIFKSKPFMKYHNLLFIHFKVEKGPVEMARDLLEGKISSRTGLGERGRGFACITKNAAHKEFKKFIIITNNVKIDIKAKVSEELENEFKGTFIYWEVANVN